MIASTQYHQTLSDLQIEDSFRNRLVWRGAVGFGIVKALPSVPKTFVREYRTQRNILRQEEKLNQMVERYSRNQN